MLHPVPDSSFRARLLQVVEMQRQLMAALCALAPGSVVDEPWLRAVWPQITNLGWLRKFWKNDRGKRADWCGVIAAADIADKNALLAIIAEQLRFSELYDDPPTVRLAVHAWKSPTMEAANDLLKSFYAPLFYKSVGFPNADGTVFHKDIFIDGFTPQSAICPYTDDLVQDVKLDHFLPKDHFPMLSCHPDNLIPCGTDANSIGHKGSKIPFDRHESNQSANWFHPRRRSAIGKYRVTFHDRNQSRPQVQLEALDPTDQVRLDRMDSMFGLAKFWSQRLAHDLQSVAGEVSGSLRWAKIPPTVTTIREALEHAARQKKTRIGHDSLAICTASFYEHILATPSLFDQVVRTCVSGT